MRSHAARGLNPLTGDAGQPLLQGLARVLAKRRDDLAELLTIRARLRSRAALTVRWLCSEPDSPCEKESASAYVREDDQARMTRAVCPHGGRAGCCITDCTRGTPFQTHRLMNPALRRDWVSEPPRPRTRTRSELGGLSKLRDASRPHTGSFRRSEPASWRLSGPRSELPTPSQVHASRSGGALTGPASEGAWCSRRLAWLCAPASSCRRAHVVQSARE